MKIHRHHLLEIILWPNEDGTFRTIHNSAKRLCELGIYDDFKMTIQITDSEHMRLHMLNESEESRAHHRHDSYGFKGKHHSDEHKQYMSKKLAGRHHSEEAKMKMKAAWAKRRAAKQLMSQKARQRDPECYKGRILSEEHKQKLSEAHKGKAPWNKGLHYKMVNSGRTGKPHHHKGRTGWHWKLVNGKRVWYEQD